jgi:translation initiation factor 2 beta subunit (eIF-2beta)/eIF-5
LILKIFTRKDATAKIQDAKKDIANAMREMSHALTNVNVNSAKMIKFICLKHQIAKIISMQLIIQRKLFIKPINFNKIKLFIKTFVEIQMLIP